MPQNERALAWLAAAALAAGCAHAGAPTQTPPAPPPAPAPLTAPARPAATPRPQHAAPIGRIPLVRVEGANVAGIERVVRADEEFTEERIARQLDADVLAVQAACADEGYLDARVEVHVGREALAPPFLDVEIDVAEGVRYRIGDVAIADTSGGPPIAATRARPLGAWITLKRGDWFSRVRMVEDIAALARAYRDEGYADVDIAPTIDRHASSATADLSLRIDRGGVVRVGRVDVLGAKRIPESKLRAAIAVKVGGLYSESAIDKSIDALRAIDGLEDVHASTADGPDRAHRTLVFEVVERQAGAPAPGGPRAEEVSSLDDARRLPEARAAAKRTMRLYPYSRLAKDAELRVAEIDGRLEAYALAASEYDAWCARHPTDPRVASVRQRQADACRAAGAACPR